MGNPAGPNPGSPPAAAGNKRNSRRWLQTYSWWTLNSEHSSNSISFSCLLVSLQVPTCKRPSTYVLMQTPKSTWKIHEVKVWHCGWGELHVGLSHRSTTSRCWHHQRHRKRNWTKIKEVNYYLNEIREHCSNWTETTFAYQNLLKATQEWLARRILMAMDQQVPDFKIK